MNAPAGGAYLMALYTGQAGVHQVDWYWQRQADASLPRQAVLLFDREASHKTAVGSSSTL